VLILTGSVFAPIIFLLLYQRLKICFGEKRKKSVSIKFRDIGGQTMKLFKIMPNFERF